MSGRHRAQKESRWENFLDNHWRPFRYDIEDLWQGATIVLAMLAVMGVAIYLVAYGGWH